MKKYKKYYAVNNQEDEDSSTHPLYPETAYIYYVGKRKKESNTEIKIPKTIGEINNQHKKGKKKPFTNFQSL
jgi:hypothetical protein